MRNPAADLATRHPLRVALLIVLGYFAYFAIPGAFSAHSFGRGETRTDVGTMTAQGVTELLLAASVLAVVLLIGWARQARLTTPIRLRRLWWVLPPLAFMALLLGLVLLIPGDGRTGAVPGWGALIPLLLAVALVGLFEEVLFRGILFHGLEAASGPLTALLVSSFLFGAMHYVNWIGGQPFGDTTFQVLHAAASGFLYGAILLMTGSIWPGVLLHACWDGLVSLLSTLTASAPATLDTNADAANGAAAAVEGGPDVFGLLLLGFEPGYGLIVLLAWLALRRSAAAQAPRGRRPAR